FKGENPLSKCRVTDSFLRQAYDIAAHIGNSLFVLLLAQSQILLPEMAGGVFGNTNDAALQGFGLMSWELGCLSAALVDDVRSGWHRLRYWTTAGRPFEV
ncbi:hypothetical protein GOODEAATRI_008295, partial [Goodea atripinnis]